MDLQNKIKNQLKKNNFPLRLKQFKKTHLKDLHQFIQILLQNKRSNIY